MDLLSNLTKALIWDPNHDQFDLLDPSTVPITCIGITSYTQRKCDNEIDEQNIAITKSVTHDLLHPEATEPREAASQVRNLLSNLAKATLYQQEHQDQAAALSQKWYSNYEWCEPDAQYAPSTHSGGSGVDDWEHELRQDWKESATRISFQWEVNREHPRRFNLPSVMVESLKLQEQARLDDLASAEREREEQAREAERERQEQAREAERERGEQARGAECERGQQAREAGRVREARYQAAMRRKLAEQIAQAEEDQRSMQQSGAEKETLRAARQFQLGDGNRHATQTRAEAREQLRAAEESRLEKEEKARVAEEAQRLEAKRGEAE
jgi:hypothetical protein